MSVKPFRFLGSVFFAVFELTFGFYANLSVNKAPIRLIGAKASDLVEIGVSGALHAECRQIV